MALILDNLVEKWLLRNGLDLKSQPWSERRYSAYLTQMHAWAAELECAADEVEMCIFQAMANASGGQWAASPMPTRTNATEVGARRHRTGRERGRTPVALAAEARFEQAMLDIYTLAGRETGYWAGYFLRSVRQDGGLVAARKLLWQSGTSAGFERLKEEGRLDLTMESLMLRSEFRDLFTDEELIRAATRLEAHGYHQDRS
jgi:hypothetical protein